jgi:hypothetical protein
VTKLIITADVPAGTLYRNKITLELTAINKQLSLFGEAGRENTFFCQFKEYFPR